MKSSDRQPPIRIPLSFDEAVTGLLGVDPREPEEDIRQRAADLRRKIERKTALVEKHRDAAVQVTTNDDAARATRKYHEGLARHHDELRRQLQDELNELIGGS